MRLCLVLLSTCIILCKGFIFDSCQTDSDCTGGCCRNSGSLFASHRCIHSHLRLHSPCHLSGTEYTNCGCGTGLVCMDHSEESSIAFETKPGYGYCERSGAQATNSTTGSGVGTTPLIATEG